MSARLAVLGLLAFLAPLLASAQAPPAPPPSIGILLSGTADRNGATSKAATFVCTSVSPGINPIRSRCWPPN